MSFILKNMQEITQNNINHYFRQMTALLCVMVIVRAVLHQIETFHVQFSAVSTREEETLSESQYNKQ